MNRYIGLERCRCKMSGSIGENESGRGPGPGTFQATARSRRVQRQREAEPIVTTSADMRRKSRVQPRPACGCAYPQINQAAARALRKRLSAQINLVQARASRKLPGPGNREDVGFLAHVGRQLGIRRGQSNDAHGGLVEQIVAGRAQHLYAFDRAVGEYLDAEDQAALEVALSGLFRVVHVAHALDLGDPCAHVAGIKMFARVGGDELASWALGYEAL